MTRPAQTIGPVRLAWAGHTAVLSISEAGPFAVASLDPQTRAALQAALGQEPGPPAVPVPVRPRPPRGMAVVLAPGERRVSADGDVLTSREEA